MPFVKIDFVIDTEDVVQIVRFRINDQFLIGAQLKELRDPIDSQNYVGSLTDVTVTNNRIRVSVRSVGDAFHKWSIKLKTSGKDILPSPIEFQINGAGRCNVVLPDIELPWLITTDWLF